MVVTQEGIRILFHDFTRFRLGGKRDASAREGGRDENPGNGKKCGL